jgi:hypothetical protein
MTSTPYPDGTTLVSSALLVEQVNETVQTITSGMLGLNPTSPADPAYYAVRIEWPPEGQPAWTRKQDIAFIRCVESIAEYGKVFDQTWSQNPGGLATITANTAKYSTTLSGLNTLTAFNGGPIAVGMQLTGAGIVPNTSVTGILSATAISISQAATATGTGVALTCNNVTVVQTLQYNRVWSINWTLYGPNAYDRTRMIRDALILDWTDAAFAAVGLYLVTDIPRPVRLRELFEGNWWQRVDLSNVLFNEVVVDTITVPSIAASEIKLYTEDQGLVADITVPNQKYPG